MPPKRGGARRAERTAYSVFFKHTGDNTVKSKAEQRKEGVATVTDGNAVMVGWVVVCMGGWVAGEETAEG